LKVKGCVLVENDEEGDDEDGVEDYDIRNTSPEGVFENVHRLVELENICWK